MIPVRDDVNPEVVITRHCSESIRDVSTSLDMTRKTVATALQFDDHRALIELFVQPGFELVKHFHGGAYYFAAKFFVNHLSVISGNRAGGTSEIEAKAATGSGKEGGSL
jgi:hypothetical protein